MFCLIVWSLNVIGKLEGEDFDSFYNATQQLAFDADLVKNHCDECSKKCLESRAGH